MWKEAELNLRKYCHGIFWNCGGELGKPLRISGNQADICIRDFFNTKCQLDRDARSDLGNVSWLWRNTFPVPCDWWCNVVCWRDDEKRAVTSIGHESAEILDVT
jgi:hypothetical protein